MAMPTTLNTRDELHKVGLKGSQPVQSIVSKCKITVLRQLTIVGNRAEQ